MIRLRFLLIFVLSACTHYSKSTHSTFGTDFHFTLTRIELKDTDKNPRQVAVEIIKKIDSLKLSQVVLTTDAFYVGIKDEGMITQLNHRIIEISNVRPQTFVASCAISLRQNYWGEMRNCRMKNVYVYTFDFSSSKTNFSSNQNLKKFSEVLAENQQYSSTMLLRGSIGITNPNDLFEILKKMDKLKFVISDARFLYANPIFLTLPNLFFEISDVFSSKMDTYGFEVSQLMARVPHSKILYGSGMTLSSDLPRKNSLSKLGISLDTLRSINNKNSQKFGYLFSRTPLNLEGN